VNATVNRNNFYFRIEATFHPQPLNADSLL